MQVRSGTRDATGADGTRRWTVPLRPARTAARQRVVLFPHAGSGLAPYRPLAAQLPDSVDVVGVLPPGREERGTEAPHYTLAEAVRGVTRELAAAADPAGAARPPTVFYGHSLGSLLAVLSAHTARREATAAAVPGGCEALVLTCGMPGARGCTRPEGLRGPDGRAAVLAEHGLPGDAPVGSRLSKDQRILAGDLVVAHQALAAIDPIRLTQPVTVLCGADDRLVPPVTLPLWAPFTTGPFRGQVVEGGHFFPFTPQGRDRVAAELTAAVARPAAVRTARPGVRAQSRRASVTTGVCAPA